ncbi:MAG: Stp1/IreP family PP2C-type Ser/Thr phosphatase [Clostridia bacterium]|nr:Stp1/IreP family PP2C-type Ser/Thr phosphatase [Clostridia bacterium]
MRFEGKSHIGLVRTVNQDTFQFHQLPEGRLLAVVCDGMGGPAGGEVASALAVDSVSRDIVLGYSVSADEEELLRLVRSAIEDANRTIYEKSLTQESLAGMGTTIVLALVTEEAAYVASVGDSRAYLYSAEAGKPCLLQITHDHSVVQELVDGGTLSSEMARTHPKKNIITRALGTQNTVNIDYFKVILEKEDRLLLCTDGLTNMLEEKQILSILEEHPDVDVVDAFISASLDAGANDNVTVAMVQR